MDLSSFLILSFIGIAAGVLSGVMGVGGGIVIVPMLVFFMGFSQKEAQGTSLAVLLPPIAIFGVWEYYKQGQINLWYATLIAVMFVVGNLFGAKIALRLDDQILKKVFAVLLFFVAIKTWFSK